MMKRVLMNAIFIQNSELNLVSIETFNRAPKYFVFMDNISSLPSILQCNHDLVLVVTIGFTISFDSRGKENDVRNINSYSLLKLSMLSITSTTSCANHQNQTEMTFSINTCLTVLYKKHRSLF